MEFITHKRIRHPRCLTSQRVLFKDLQLSQCHTSSTLLISTHTSGHYIYKYADDTYIVIPTNQEQLNSITLHSGHKWITYNSTEPKPLRLYSATADVLYVTRLSYLTSKWMGESLWLALPPLTKCAQSLHAIQNLTQQYGMCDCLLYTSDAADE